MTAADHPPPPTTLRQQAEARLRQQAAAEAAAPTPVAVQRTDHELRVHQIELEMQNEELRRTQAELDAERARYFDLYDLAPVGYCTLSTQGLILQANLTAATLLGVTRSALRHQRLAAFIHPEDQDRYYLLRQRLVATGAPQDGELRLVTRDGTAYWAFLQATLAPSADAAPEVRLVISDISARKHAEAQLHLAASVFRHAREGILITAVDGTILDVNDAFTHITGYPRDEVLGRNPRLLHSGRHDPAFFAALWRDLITPGYWSGEIWNRRKTGEVYAERLTISAVRDAHGRTQHYVGLFSDVSLLKEHEEQLNYLAHYDALTQLPNRVLLADRLHQAMAQAQRSGLPVAVILLDLDDFKAINDDQGHALGDQFLTQVAAHMRQALREGDTLARLGGDEFVAVLNDLADTTVSA